MRYDLAATNLVPSPKPVNTNGWRIFGGSANIEFRMTADGTGFYVRNTTGGGGRGIQYEFSNLTPGDYCYGLYAITPYHKVGNQLALIDIPLMGGR